MDIEFSKAVIGGRTYVAANIEDSTLCLLDIDGSVLRTYGATLRYDHLEQIANKMKELQNANN